MEREAVVWAENRDEIFVNRLAEDIGKLQDAGFDNKDIPKMLGRLSYVRFWVGWPRWAFPVDKLPKGYKWSDGIKYKKKKFGMRDDAETYVFLPIGADLYIKRGNGDCGMPGINIREKVTFLQIINFRDLTANEFLQGIDYSPFFRSSALYFWRQNGLPLGWAEPCFKGLSKELDSAMDDFCKAYNEGSENHGNNDIKLPAEEARTGEPEEPAQEPGRNQGTV